MLKSLELGLKVACEKGFSKVIIETDSFMVVNLMNQGENVMWVEGSLIVDILDVASSYVSCEFVHVSREVNTLSHNIAKIEDFIEDYYVWEGNISYDI